MLEVTLIRLTKCLGNLGGKGVKLKVCWSDWGAEHKEILRVTVIVRFNLQRKISDEGDAVRLESISVIQHLPGGRWRPRRQQRIDCA